MSIAILEGNLRAINGIWAVGGRGQSQVSINRLLVKARKRTWIAVNWIIIRPSLGRFQTVCWLFVL